MCSLLRDSSHSRQPPPGTVFALSCLAFGPSRRRRPFTAGTTLPRDTLGAFGGLGLSPARFAEPPPRLGGSCRLQMPAYRRRHIVDRSHAVHALEDAF